MFVALTLTISPHFVHAALTTLGRLTSFSLLPFFICLLKSRSFLDSEVMAPDFQQSVCKVIRVVKPLVHWWVIIQLAFPFFFTFRFGIWAIGLTKGLFRRGDSYSAHVSSVNKHPHLHFSCIFKFMPLFLFPDLLSSDCFADICYMTFDTVWTIWWLCLWKMMKKMKTKMKKRPRRELPRKTSPGWRRRMRGKGLGWPLVTSPGNSLALQ